MSETKKQLRNQILTLREQMEKEQVIQQSKLIWNHIYDLSAFKKAGHIGIYANMQNEVETLSYVDKLVKQGRKIYFPKVYPAVKEMHFFEVQDVIQLEKGTFDVLEPPEFHKASRLDLMIVPGVAFDKNGNRLGYGAGYYDRFFEKHQLICKIGISFEFQRLKEIPTNSFDVPMDWIITEKNTYFTSK